MAHAEARIVYDESVPLLTAIEPPKVIGVDSTMGAQTSFTGSVSDARPGLKEIALYLKNRTTGKFLASASDGFTANEETKITPELSGDKWELKLPDSVFSEGDYELRIRAEDLAGNVSILPLNGTAPSGSDTFAFHWDQTPPNPAFTIAAGKAATKTRQLTAKITTVDADVESYKLSIGASCNDIDWQPFTQMSGSIPITLPDTDDKYSVCLTLRDHVGNESKQEVQQIVLDRIAPEISIASLATISPANSINNRVQIRGTASDDRSGLATIRVSVRHAQDLCLNATGTAFDAQCPTWHAATTGGNWLAAVSHEPFLYTDGLYSVTAEAEDQAGNVSPEPVVSPFNWRASLADINIVKAPTSPSNALTPQITIGGTNAQSYKTKVVQGGAANCGLQGYGSEITFGQPSTLNVSGQPDGQYTVCAVGRDFNGFWQLYPVTATWIKDTVPPVVTTPQVIRTKQPIEIQATSNKIGTYSWSKTSGSGNLTFSTPTSLNTWVNASQDGSYQIKLTVIDTATNTSSSDTTLVWDTTAPQAGGNGVLTYSNVSYKALTVSWSAATDALTTAANMTYQLYLSPNAVIDDIDTIDSLGTPVGSSLIGTTTENIQGLTPGTTYYFNVVAADELGHKTLYQMGSASTTTDVTPPVVGAGGTLTVANYSESAVTLNWMTANDDQSVASKIKYFVYKSLLPNIDTLQNVTANGGIPVNGIFGTQNIGTFTVTGLTPSTRYYFAVVAEDEAGNRALYLNVNQKTRVGPVVAANSTLSIVGGASAVGSGSTITVMLQARDVTGAPLASGGAITVLNQIGGSSTFYETFPLAGADLGNGTYRFQITGKQSGSATTLTAAINGQPVTATTNLAVIPGPISASSSTLAVVGGVGQLASGSPATLRLTAYDFAGNRISQGGAQISLSIAAGSSTFVESFPVTANDRGDGTYEAAVTGLIAGTPSVFNATINAVPATATTNIEVIPGPVDISNSLVSSPSNLGPGSSANLVFTARDTAGNVLRSGGQTVTFLKTGGTGTTTQNSPLAAADNGDGTYTAQMTGALAGPITFAGKIGSGVTSATTTTNVIANVIATASGHPTGNSLVTAQNINIGGTGIVKYKYKLGTATSTDCTLAAGYSSELPVSSAITDDIVNFPDGAVNLCIIGADFAPNWQDLTIATKITWNKIRVPPAFTSLALINDVADGYLNASESNNPNLLAGSLVASTYDTADYAVASIATTCDASLTYGTMPASTALHNLADGDYKICVKLWNTSNPPVYAASPIFKLKKSLPDFTSLALASEASDGFVNLAERSSSNELVSNLAGLSFDSASYKLVTASTTCDNQLTYGLAPKGSSNDFGSDGSYKVCVKLTDLAGNPADFGESPAIVLKTIQPAFTSLGLTGDASDTYINAAERNNSTPLVGNAVGTAFDSAAYKLVAATSNCAQQTNFGSKPNAAATEFTTDGDYKVCAKISDNAGNPPAFGSSPNITLKVTPAAFTSLTRSHAAADGYINAADHAMNSALAGNLVASNFDAASYKLVSSSVVCDANLTFGSMPLANATEFTSDGLYKICVRLDDNAGNPAVYADGPTVTLKLNGPSFTSVSLSAATGDGYLNAAENQSATPLAQNLQGLRYDNATYTVVTDLTACNENLSYGAVPQQNSAEFAADGSYKVCVKLTDLAANPPAFGSSTSFDLKRATPTFTSLDLVGDAADGYVSTFDRQAAQPIAGNLDAFNYDSVGYKLVSSSVTCDQSLTYSNMPTAASTDFTTDGQYKVCVKLNDIAGNPAVYGASPIFTLKTAPPTFTSIALANAAADTYLNAQERSLTTAIVDPAIGNQFDLATYKIVPNSGVCNGSLSYGNLPTANSTDITTDGVYKVCVKLTDFANNTPDYDESTPFTVKTSSPSFTAATLSGDVVDGYLNASERTSSAPLTSSATGNNFDVATYKLAATSVSCDGNLAYGQLPQSNDNSFTVDGSYRVCVRLSDHAGNPPAFGSSSSFTLKTALPFFTSIARAGDAQDGYINLAESLLSKALAAQPSGLNFDQSTFALVSSSTSCDSVAVSYGTIPTSTSSNFTTDGSYKVCVKLTDNANNTPAYGNTDSIQLKRNSPIFTSVALALSLIHI